MWNVAIYVLKFVSRKKVAINLFVFYITNWASFVVVPTSQIPGQGACKGGGGGHFRACVKQILYRVCMAFFLIQLGLLKEKVDGPLKW